MQIVTGNPVTGEDFFDREQLIANLWQTLEADSVLLAAPRRVGKSSIMLRLREAPAAGFHPVYLEAEYYNAPEDLVTDLAVKAGELRNDFRHVARKLLTGLRGSIDELEAWKIKVKLREQLAGSWQEQGDAAIRAALPADGKLLLIIDEFPLFLHKIASRDDDGRQAALSLLDWLRHLRHEPDIRPNMRQVVGGSVGMAQIASSLGATHKINDLAQISVGPFSHDAAAELARRLFASRDIEANTLIVEELLRQVETHIPIFIQILVSAVASEVRDNRTGLTPKLVQWCYEERALGPQYRNRFEDYYERLDRYYVPDEARTAKRLLRELAVADGPVPRNNLQAMYQEELGGADGEKFDLLLSWLHDDFYVEERGPMGQREVVFQSKWLRDWWRIYHASI